MNKKFKTGKKIISLMLSIAIAVSMFTGITFTSASAESYPDAWTITSDMKIGWNLGNALDSIYWSDSPTPQQSVTAWGNPEPTQKLIDKVKSLGFNTVRIPTTWYQHLTYDQSKDLYTVDADWMAYVKKTVDYAYNNNMYVILNVHHENWLNVDRFTESTLTAAKKKLSDIWSQISEQFAGYDYHLIFEGMNEPRQTYDSSVEWGNGDSYSWSYINQLNKVFVDTVRGSSAANNKNRLIMIPGYHASDSYEALDAVEIPANAGNVALSVHAYEPYSFTMDTTESHIYKSNNKYGGYNPSTLASIMSDLKIIQKSKNAPIIIGEFGASDFDNTSERVLWAKDYIKQAKAAGFVCVLWDNNASNSGTSESFGFINRSTNELYANSEKVITAMINTINGIDDGNGGDGNDTPTEDVIAQWDSKVLFTNNAYADGKYDIVITYSADSAPRVILEKKDDYSWDATVEADRIENGKAYYTAASITAALEKNNMTQADVNKICMLATATTKYGGVEAVEASNNDGNDTDGGEKLSAWSGKTLFEGNLYADGKYNIVISYKGSSAPLLILERTSDYSWDIRVEASRTENGKAYYTAADIITALKNNDMTQADVSKICMLTTCETVYYSAEAVENVTKKRPDNTTNFRMTARTASSVTFSWDRNTTADGYILEVADNGTWKTAAVKEGNGSVSHKFTDLKSATWYRFRLRTYVVSNGKKLYSTEYPVIAEMTAPETITGVSLGARTASTISLKWNKNTTTSGCIIEQYINGAWKIIVTKNSQSSVSHKITGLASSMEYKFRLRSFRVSGEKRVYGSYSDIITVATSPKNVANFRTAISASTAIRLNWNKATDADGFDIYMYKNGKWVRDARVAGTAVAYAKTGLTPKTEYKFAIRPYKVIGSTTVYGNYAYLETATK